MKHVLMVLMLVISATVYAESTKLDGVWKSGNVEMTFIKDTLYIDEIDNEGFGYIYSFDSKTNIVKAVSPVFETDMLFIKIVKFTKGAFSFYFMDGDDKKVYTFYRKKIQIPALGF